eukprot:scaffold41423_cov34-Attheya_sp.AAC.4
MARIGIQLQRSCQPGRTRVQRATRWHRQGFRLSVTVTSHQHENPHLSKSPSLSLLPKKSSSFNTSAIPSAS